MRKPDRSKYIQRGVVGGLLLGALAWLAVWRGRGGQLSLASGDLDGIAAGLVLLIFGLIAGLIVAASAYVMMSVLTRNSAE
ncbi:MAG: hypothetical protein AAGH82_02200 [Pseudomonadota bacterium]